MSSSGGTSQPGQYRSSNGSERLTCGLRTLRQGKGEPGRPDDAMQQAITFLQQTLATGAKPIKQVLSEGERRSHAERTLRRAAKKVGVQKEGKNWKIAKKSL